MPAKARATCFLISGASYVVGPSSALFVVFRSKYTFGVMRFYSSTSTFRFVAILQYCYCVVVAVVVVQHSFRSKWTVLEAYDARTV